MTKRFNRVLDRYVFGEFWKIFLPMAIGFPVLIVIIDLTDNLGKYLSRNIPRADLALSYVYFVPESMFMVLPAAVLFATVFSIGALTRHAEITAAKASGISFYRLVLPILIAAMMVCGIDLALGEVVPISNQRRAELLGEDKARQGSARWNFAFQGEGGRVYKVMELHTDSGSIRFIQIERKGSGPNYPSYLLASDGAKFDPRTRQWRLASGSLNIMPDSGSAMAVNFQSARDNNFTEYPTDMMTRPRAPEEMRYKELTRSIAAIERSGGEANLQRVTRGLKLAVPVTCIIIALFGAPLATSTQRGGAAYGIGVSLATTMIFLLLIQLTKAVGVKGVIHPADLAAWIPSAIFGLLGLILMARVRT
jgi:lipopolysaccharide export system permease protein